MGPRSLPRLHRTSQNSRRARIRAHHCSARCVAPVRGGTFFPSAPPAAPPGTGGGGSSAGGIEPHCQHFSHMPAARTSATCTCGLVAMTSASHAEGRQFDPGQVYLQWHLHDCRHMLFDGSEPEWDRVCEREGQGERERGREREREREKRRGGHARARSRHRADTEGASDGPSLVQRRARGSCMFMLYKDAYACSCMYMCLCV